MLLGWKEEGRNADIVFQPSSFSLSISKVQPENIRATVDFFHIRIIQAGGGGVQESLPGLPLINHSPSRRERIWDVKYGTSWNQVQIQLSASGWYTAKKGLWVDFWFHPFKFVFYFKHSGGKLWVFFSLLHETRKMTYFGKMICFLEIYLQFPVPLGMARQ